MNNSEQCAARAQTYHALPFDCQPLRHSADTIVVGFNCSVDQRDRDSLKPSKVLSQKSSSSRGSGCFLDWTTYDQMENSVQHSIKNTHWPSNVQSFAGEDRHLAEKEHQANNYYHQNLAEKPKVQKSFQAISEQKRAKMKDVFGLVQKALPPQIKILEETRCSFTRKPQHNFYQHKPKQSASYSNLFNDQQRHRPRPSYLPDGQLNQSRRLLNLPQPRFSKGDFISPNSVKPCFYPQRIASPKRSKSPLSNTLRAPQPYKNQTSVMQPVPRLGTRSLFQNSIVQDTSGVTPGLPHYQPRYSRRQQIEVIRDKSRSRVKSIERVCADIQQTKQKTARRNNRLREQNRCKLLFQPRMDRFKH